MIYFGKITLTDGSAGEKGWEGYQLVFTHSTEIDGVLRSLDRSIAVRSDGSYFLELGSLISSDASITVVSPAGETLARRNFSTLIEDGTANLKPFPVQPRDLKLVIDSIAAPTDQRVRVSGHVFAAAGAAGDHSAAAKLEVRILGAPREGSPFLPIFSGITNRSGYFAGSVQRQWLVAAFAETGTGAALVKHTIPITPENWLPQPVLLFIDAQATIESDCGCTAPPSMPDSTELAVNGEAFSADLGASCQDFTVPNRTLEEFDFFKIVRTTDPTIKGLTIPDTVRNELDLPEITSLAFDQGALSKTLGASSLAMQTAPKPPAQDLFVSSDIRRTTAPSTDGARAMARLATLVANPAAAGPSALTDTGTADYLEVNQLEASGVRRAAVWGSAIEEKAIQTAVRAAVEKIPPATLKATLQDPDGFTPESLMTLEQKDSAQALAAYLNWRAKPFVGRSELSESNLMDWDATPEFYQATSIGHGHIFHFKQEWRADRYSLRGGSRASTYAGGGGGAGALRHCQHRGSDTL